MLTVIHFYAKSGIFYTEFFQSAIAMRRRLARLARRVLRIVRDDEE
jgi:hypothetical protein